MDICGADGRDGHTTTALLGHQTLEVKASLGCRLITSPSAIFKLVLILHVWCSTLVQITRVGIDRWFVKLPCGDWFCIPVGALCNYPGSEHSQNTTKGWSVPVKVSALLFESLCKCHQSLELHCGIKNMAVKGLDLVTELLCADDVPSFPT